VFDRSSRTASVAYICRLLPQLPGARHADRFGQREPCAHRPFWISAVARLVPPDDESGLHLGFSAPTRRSVDAFHAAALAAGGRDNGAPGVRADYGANYYAAFVVDPDGYRIEAYCGRATPRSRAGDQWGCRRCGPEMGRWFRRQRAGSPTLSC
jgi:hypothetical protein